MKLHKLPKLVEVPKKRIGRGHGSGKVKTGGRGQKGQKARGTVRAGFEGGQISIRHSLPFLRGKGRNHSQKSEVIGIPLVRLSVYKSGETVDLKTLKTKGLIDENVQYVKIIGNTPVVEKLKITLPTTSGAREAIIKAGGTVSV